MAFGDLFKSKKEREQEQAKKRRKAFREAESAVNTVKSRTEKLQVDRDTKWKEAKGYLRDGQKGVAQRCLQSCRASELMIQKLEMKKWVFEQLLTKLEMAKTDHEFATALNAINAVVKIDPEAIAGVMDDVEDKLGEQKDSDSVWEKAHAKEMAGLAGTLSETVPSVEQMFKDLEDEVTEAKDEESLARAVLRKKERTGDNDTEDLRKRARKIIEGGQP